MSNLDRRFFERFGIVLGALLLFTVAMYFLANRVADATQVQWVKEEIASSGEQQARLDPVGRVAITGQTPAETPPAEPAAAGGAPAPADPNAAAAAAAPATSAATPAAASGEEIYNSACFACHATGAAGAPKLGDAADWSPRIAQGKDTLVQHAINGYQGQKGIMPPKGGRADFSDEAVAAAVEYMMSKAQ